MNDEEGEGSGRAFEDAGGIGLESDAEFICHRVRHGDDFRTRERENPDRCDRWEQVLLGEGFGGGQL
jgi:hypothetical protein